MLEDELGDELGDEPGERLAPPRDLQVQERPCRTCPFEGTGGAFFHQSGDMSGYLKNLVELNGQHYCHSVNNSKICRGGRNLQVRIAFVQRLIPQPTNEAFEALLASPTQEAFEEKVNRHRQQPAQ